MSRRVVPVSTLVHYLKESMEGDPVLHGVMIEGEISNLRKPYSGHWYFSLKDERASISCVMFASRNRSVKFTPKNGDKVVIKGDVSVYEAMGNMQVIATAMQPYGIGDLYLQLEALKKKLSAEGLFDAEHKKPIPAYAMDIALVSGNNTAAREDVLITLHRRWPIAKITEYPAPVQGMDAAPKIIESLRKADAGNHQIIILARGGGSLEDLWCFNDENLARFIYQMHTPVITGIGHEIDFTIADYVADLRANTPTGAAEAAVPDMEEVSASLAQYRVRMISHMHARLDLEKSQLNRLGQNTVFTRPERLYSDEAMKLNMLEEKLMQVSRKPKEKKAELSALFQRFNQCIYARSAEIRNQVRSNESRLILSARRSVDQERNRLHNDQDALIRDTRNVMNQKKESYTRMVKLLDAYSPLKVLERGYSITSKDGTVVKRTADLKEADSVSVRLSDGTFDAEVKEIHHG